MDLLSAEFLSRTAPSRAAPSLKYTEFHNLRFIRVIGSRVTRKIKMNFLRPRPYSFTQGTENHRAAVGRHRGFACGRFAAPLNL
jgi:hypothetical protein